MQPAPYEIDTTTEVHPPFNLGVGLLCCLAILYPKQFLQENAEQMTSDGFVIYQSPHTSLIAYSEGESNFDSSPVEVNAVEGY